MPDGLRPGWKPTKFDVRNGKPRASRTNVPISSRLTADLIAQSYHSALVLHARGDLIDLGCGNAPLAGFYAPIVDSYTLADWPNSLHQETPIDLTIDLNGPLSIAAQSYDTLVLTDVLEHIYAPHDLISELFRICRPGGKLIIGVPFMYWLHEEPHDYCRYTKYMLASMAKESGFRIVNIEEYGGGLDVIGDIVCKLLFIRKFPFVSAAAYWATMIMRKLFSTHNKTAARRFPLGYTAVFIRSD